MITKAGGYYITFQDAQDWLNNHAESKYHLQDESDVTWNTRNLFKDKGVEDIRPVMVLHPRLKKAVLLFMTKIGPDSSSTFHKYAEYEETARDRALKLKILDQTGKEDKDIEWITIPDPYMDVPRRLNGEE